MAVIWGGGEKKMRDAKIFSYITAISDSSDKLFDKNIEYITLPEELSNLEKKLNHFKRESIKNEKLALENKKKKDELIVYLATWLELLISCRISLVEF